MAPEMGNPNSSGLVGGTVASGVPKEIGGPDLAGLLSFSVLTLLLPTLTVPKFSTNDNGLTVNGPGPGVGVGVGVGVTVVVAVAVAVGVPPVAVAVGVAVRVAVAVAVAVGVPPVAVAVGVAVRVAVAVAVAVLVGVAVAVGLGANAFTRLYAFTAPIPVAKSQPVCVPYAG